MGHEHAQGVAEPGITVVGTECDRQAYFGCFPWRRGESDAETATRWDSFANLMWSWGLEPIEDEPSFTVEEYGVVYDHYALVALPADASDDADEHNGHVDGTVIA